MSLGRTSMFKYSSRTPTTRPSVMSVAAAAVLNVVSGPRRSSTYHLPLSAPVPPIFSLVMPSTGLYRTAMQKTSRFELRIAAGPVPGTRSGNTLTVPTISTPAIGLPLGSSSMFSLLSNVWPRGNGGSENRLDMRRTPGGWIQAIGASRKKFLGERQRMFASTEQAYR